MEYLFDLWIGKDGLSEKPQNAYLYQQRDRYEKKTLSVKDFAEMCGNGHCWRAARYQDSDRKTFVTGDAIDSIVIGLDFDATEHNPFEIVEFAAKMDIAPNFVYPSFSQNPDTWLSCLEKVELKSPAIEYIYNSGKKRLNFLLDIGYWEVNGIIQTGLKPHMNYRLVWVLDSPLDKRTYKATVKHLIHDTFAGFEPDISTNDINRLWYGGNLGYILFNEEPINAASFGAVEYNDKRANGARANNARRASNSCISLYLEEDADIAEKVAVPDNWAELLYPVCEEFRLYKDKASHTEFDNNKRLALLVNLRQLTYARKDKASFKQDVFKLYDEEHWSGTTFTPQRFNDLWGDKTAKAYRICKYNGQLMTCAEYFKRVTAAPIQINKDNCPSIDEVEGKIDDGIQEALSTPFPTYYKSGTGSGKTERLIRLMTQEYNPFTQKIIYAVPTYVLMREIVERAKRLTSATIYELPEVTYTPQDLELMRKGLAPETQSEERKEFRRNLANDKPGIYFVTHAQLALVNSIKADLIIVDENIEETINKQYKIRLSDFRKLRGIIPEKERENLESFINSVEANDERGSKIDMCYVRSTILPFIRKNATTLIKDETFDLVPDNLFICEDVDGMLSYEGEEKAIYFRKQSNLITMARCGNIPLKLFSATPLKGLLEVYN